MGYQGWGSSVKEDSCPAGWGQGLAADWKAKATSKGPRFSPGALFSVCRSKYIQDSRASICSQ